MREFTLHGIVRPFRIRPKTTRTLFLFENQRERNPFEVEMLTNLVFEVATIPLLDPLRLIAEESKNGRVRPYLRDVLDLHELIPINRRLMPIDGVPHDFV